MNKLKEFFFWLLKTVTVMALLVIFLPVLLISLGQVLFQSSSDEPQREVVAVIDMKGEIHETEDIVKELYRQSKSEKVQGIVLRVDSPGGAVGASEEVYRTIAKIKKVKPVVVSMGNYAASGGLYVSVSASKIFAQEGTITGSIGVISMFPNVAEISDKVGFRMTTIKSGKRKDIGNMFRPINEEELEFMSEIMGNLHEQFITAVAEGRGIDIDKVRGFADGRVIPGLEAKELGLVDEIGGLHDAARAVYDLLEKPLPEGEYPKLFYPGDKFADLKEILQEMEGVIASFSPKAGIYMKLPGF